MRSAHQGNDLLREESFQRGKEAISEGSTKISIYQEGIVKDISKSMVNVFLPR
jgi:hypothetical protein